MQPHEFILETPRLLFRKLFVEDAPFFYELNSDSMVTKYTGDVAFENMKGAEDIIKYIIDQYNTNGYGRLMVIEKESSNPIGWCGLKYQSNRNETDIGYRFSQKHWHKGYATEASMACLYYGFNTLKLNRIIGRAMKENIASINVLKKIGMKYYEDIYLHKIISEVYELKKEDYR